MKLLLLHSSHLEYQAHKKALDSAEDTDKEKHRTEECLVAFNALDEGDEKNLESVATQAAEEIKDVAEQVNVENIVIYPWVHLTSTPGKPDKAEKIQAMMEDKLKDEYDVTKSPFGWYKEFEIHVKGHPLSELSREISPEGEEEEVEVNELSEEERQRLVKKMSKINMSTKEPPGGKKSHIELGRDLDLYISNQIVGHGLPLFTPKGATIRREIKRFIEDEEIRRGYEHTDTPEMAKSDLYKLSGHWQHYRDDMFTMEIGDEDYALRPMTCPFHFALYKRKPRSYKDLPKRYAEVSTLFRNEKSGELRGLTRVRQFELADAHIICREDQLEKEFQGVLDLIEHVMDKLGIEDIWYRFSKWDPKGKGNKYIDDPKAWEKSERIMKKILKDSNLDHVEEKGEAAFYGPKLDLQYKDVYGKEDTLITVQIDFALPDRFDLTYKNEDDEEERPIVIHRSSVGCIGRTIANLLEKTQGNLPVWLSPVQMRVINHTDRNKEACKEFVEKMKEEVPDIRIDTDLESSRISSKIKKVEMEKIPYAVVIGDKEEENDTLAIRRRWEDNVDYGVNPEDFIQEIKEKINKRK
ncbi:MAG: threonine--tRNA ligase [Candidatus Aenigmatarchaeota archaeon]